MNEGIWIAREKFDAMVDVESSTAMSEDEREDMRSKLMESTRGYGYLYIWELYGYSGTKIWEVLPPKRDEILGKRYIEVYVVFHRIFGPAVADIIARLAIFNLEFNYTLQEKLSAILAKNRSLGGMGSLGGMDAFGSDLIASIIHDINVAPIGKLILK